MDDLSSMSLARLKQTLAILINEYEIKQQIILQREKEKKVESIRLALKTLPKEESTKRRGYLIRGQVVHMTEREYTLYMANPNISEYDLIGAQL